MTVQRISEYLSVRLMPPRKGYKTKRWEVLANDNAVLGKIFWFGRWRQYVFQPAEQTVFNSKCLDDLRCFLYVENENQREARRLEVAQGVKP